MAKKLTKKSNGGSQPSKSTRLENRANRVMGRAQKTFAKLESARKAEEREPTSTGAAYGERLANKVSRLESKAKSLKERADVFKSVNLKKGGSVKSKRK